MDHWPAVNMLVPPVAGVVAMAVGAAFWGVTSRFAADVAAPTGSWPAAALAFALLGRMIVAYALAVILGFAHAHGILAGVVAGALACLAFTVPMLVAQALFGVTRWRDLTIGGVEPVIAYSVVGAVVGAFTA